MIIKKQQEQTQQLHLLFLLKKKYKRRAEHFIQTSRNVNQITAKLNKPYNF